jgi:hypothetical protein
MDRDHETLERLFAPASETEEALEAIAPELGAHFAREEALIRTSVEGKSGK